MMENKMTTEIALHCMKAQICEELCEECQYYGTTGTDHCEEDAIQMAISAIEEIQQYRTTGMTPEQIKDMQMDYCAKGAVLEEYKKIGTVEEINILKEKLENAKEDIRKLLCSEYGSSCDFCVHDENEDAICCNVGGSGSWCCKNARWKEH